MSREAFERLLGPSERLFSAALEEYRAANEREAAAVATGGAAAPPYAATDVHVEPVAAMDAAPEPVSAPAVEEPVHAVAEPPAAEPALNVEVVL